MLESKKVKAFTLIMTLGIVYGDIGTSPLYVMSAIIGANNGFVQRDYILGVVSLIVWTLILMTTVKYVWQILNADNNGEGGILSLFALVRTHYKKLIIPAVIGSASLLAESIITPSVTVISAVEGLKDIMFINGQMILVIVFIILTILFLVQHFGTEKIGKTFGIVMFGWFSFLAIIGITGILKDTCIIKALNPIYGIRLLFESPLAFAILGAVFLCTTGAEALYSDLGHCGKKNIRYTWIFVKIVLVLNYLGQGAYLLQFHGNMIDGNPFFMLVPNELMVFAIIFAILAAIIASQSIISGAFTLISEAIKLEIFQRLVINYPSNLKGQVYIPAVNFMMWLGCIGIVFYFRESARMEAAYGLSITIAMLMTTIMYYFYLKKNGIKKIFAYLFLVVYLIIEGAFLLSNLLKIPEGGYITILIGLCLIFIMYIWIKSRKITAEAAERVSIKDYLAEIELLQKDKSIPLIATNLVYLTQSTKKGKVEKKIIYSLLNRGFKKAEIYWFVNVIVTNEPFTMKYEIDIIKKKTIFKVHLHLGFRVNRDLSSYLQYIFEDMVNKNEIDRKIHSYRLRSISSCISPYNIDNIKFIMLNETINDSCDLKKFDLFILKLKILIKHYTISPARWFGIEIGDVEVETLPLLVHKTKTPALIRFYKKY